MIQKDRQTKRKIGLLRSDTSCAYPLKVEIPTNCFEKSSKEFHIAHSWFNLLHVQITLPNHKHKNKKI